MSDHFASRPQFDAASLVCASSLPVRTIESSRDAGWTALLLDHQQVLTDECEFVTHPTPDQTVVVMTRGKQHLEVNDRGFWRRATYRPGTIGKTSGGRSDRLRRRVDPDAGPACKINLYLPQALVEEVTARLKQTGDLTFIRSSCALAYSDDCLRMGVQLLLRGLRAGAPNLHAEAMAYWLTVHLLTSSSDAYERFESGAKSVSIRHKRLERVLDFMEHNYQQQFSLEELALQAAVSKFHFARLFREATGCTPQRWLADRRLHAAKCFLETTNDSIADIAVRCGFTRPNYFATAFSKRFGVSPSDYRLAF